MEDQTPPNAEDAPRVSGARAAALRRESECLFDAFDAMAAAADTDAALHALFDHAPRMIEGVAAVLVVGPDGGGTARVIAASQPALTGLAWAAESPPAAALLPDAAAALPQGIAATGVGPVGGAIQAPLRPVAGASPMTLVLLGGAGASPFDDDSLTLARRLAALAAQALGTIRLARRNAMLTGLISGDGALPGPGQEPLEASFDAVKEAVGRLTEAQALVTGINNDMLRARSDGIDTAIDSALARTGDFAGSDRTYVFCLHGEGRISNTHEWTAPGITPMIARLQNLPAHMMDHWRATLDADRELHIPDVAALPGDDPLKPLLSSQNIRSLLVAPLRHGDRLLGFVGYDAVRRRRNFLPGEVFLIRSVANVIAALLVRRETEARIEQARAALTAERDRMRATLEALPDLVLELDADGILRGCHASRSDALAGALARHVGAPLEAALPPAAATTLRAALAAADRGGGAESRMISVGEGAAARWYQISASARDGSAPAHVVVLRDITDARRQQRLIARLGEVARRTTNLVLVTDARGRIDWVNPAFEARSGWSLDRIRGRNPLRLLHAPGSDHRVLRRLLGALRRGQGARAEMLNRSRTGEEYWTDLDVQPLYEADGSFRGVMALQVDITALKHAERRALEERAAAMDSSRDGIAITDAAGRFVYVNPSQRAMFAIDPEADIRAMGWADIYATETASWLQRNAMPRLLRRGDWRGEVIGQRHDGAPLEQELSLTLNPDGGAIWIAHDISRRRRNAAERLRLREQLQQAQRREVIGQLAAGLAHDFNNFLAVITGSVAMIEARATACAQTRAETARITGAASRAGALVARLRDLGGRRAQREALDLRVPLTEAVQLMVPGLPWHYRLRLDLPDTPQIAYADPTDVLQVVLNLAINSRDALGGAPGEIVLSLAPALPEALCEAPDLGRIVPGRSYLAFSVCDTGPGIDAAARARIFEPYFTTKGDDGGTGLGLAIVAGLVRDNDAALRIDSAPGAGTRITILWPLTPAQDGPLPVIDSDAPGGRLDGVVALVVDDAPDVCAVLGAMLDTAGANAVGTCDPFEALEALHESPHDWHVLITDQDMPGLTGAELAGRARALRPDLPCVLVTALPDQAGRDRPLFDAVLAKPAAAGDLVAAVSLALARKAAEEHDPGSE